jgi:hypothetical protein
MTEFLFNRVRACRQKDLSFRCFKLSEKSDEAFVVLASKAQREERQATLYNIMRGAALRLGASTILGVAVGHDWPKAECCDLMFLDASRLDIDKNLNMICEEAFGSLYRSSPKRDRWFR